MLIGCPTCHGRRTMRYAVEPDLPLAGKYVDPTATVDIAFESREESCRTCKGEGRVEASKLGPEFRIPVTQRLSKGGLSRVIGSVPPEFDPARIRSTSRLYTPRHGDFVRVGDTWEAIWTLGSGDLEAVPGFVWDRSHYERG